jgi:hypothetical protein
MLHLIFQIIQTKGFVKVLCRIESSADIVFDDAMVTVFDLASFMCHARFTLLVNPVG